MQDDSPPLTVRGLMQGDSPPLTVRGLMQGDSPPLTWALSEPEMDEGVNDPRIP